MKDYKNDGRYYLIANYVDEKTFEKIEINGNKNLDISTIDLTTMTFKNKEQFIDYLFENNLISSKNVDLYISITYQYNQEIKVKNFDLIYGLNSENLSFLSIIARGKLENKEFDINDKNINHFASNFLYKSIYDINFYNFVMFEKSYIEKYAKDNIKGNECFNKKSSNIPKETQARNNSQRIKYALSSYIKNYAYLRNMILCLNTYNELNNKFEGDIVKILEEFKNSRETLEINRKKVDDVLLKKPKKNHVDGQVSMFSDNYVEKTRVEIKREDIISNNSKNDNESDSQREARLMEEEVSRLRNSPYDDPYLQALNNKGGREEVVSKGYNILMKSTLEDQYRVGLFNYIEYKRLRREQKKKK